MLPSSASAPSTDAAKTGSTSAGSGAALISGAGAAAKVGSRINPAISRVTAGLGAVAGGGSGRGPRSMHTNAGAGGGVDSPAAVSKTFVSRDRIRSMSAPRPQPLHPQVHPQPAQQTILCRQHVQKLPLPRARKARQIQRRRDGVELQPVKPVPPRRVGRLPRIRRERGSHDGQAVFERRHAGDCTRGGRPPRAIRFCPPCSSRATARGLTPSLGTPG